MINNAGIVTGRPFLELPDKQINLTFAVNSISHFYITKAFLPAMLKANEGHIVTVASMAGMVGISKLVDYCASKVHALLFVRLAVVIYCLLFALYVHS